MTNIFAGIFDSSTTTVISVGNFLLCLGVALCLGLIIAMCYKYRTKYSKSFLATLAMLPAIVAVVIMMVNGNVGAGVAVAGAFSLVRFRSVPGTAKEIGALFLSMCTGLMVGMGYLGYATLFTVIMCIVMIVYSMIDLGNAKDAEKYKVLHITVPEDLDYTGAMDEILEKYTTEHELVQVKTSNMGSLFRLTYDLTLKNAEAEKELIDKLRCRNGNLEISVSRRTTANETL